MQPPTVVNIRVANLRKLGYDDLEDWLTNPKHAYIGRDMTRYVAGAAKSKWHNPYPLSKYSAADSLKLYKKHILDSGLYDQLGELSGMVLGCWCAPKPCHGYVLRELFEEKYGGNLK